MSRRFSTAGSFTDSDLNRMAGRGTRGKCVHRPRPVVFRRNDSGAAIALAGAMLIEDARLNHLTGSILSAAIEVHRILGPGLLELTCQTCLQYELSARNLRYVPQQPISISYKDLRLEAAYRIDLIVEEAVVVEIKCVEALTDLHKSQLLTYVRLSHKPAGLLINFNVSRLMDGVKRVLNTR